VGPRYVREEGEYVLDVELKVDHGAGIALLDALLQVVVLGNELLLHGVPHHLQQVLLLAQVLLYLLVEILEAFFHLTRRILGDHLAELLFGEGHLVADLRFLDSLSHFQLHALKKLLQMEKGKYEQI